MDGPDIAQIEQRLAVIISESRSKAISYTVLTVLCTPAFVLLGSIVLLAVLAYIFRLANYEIDARGAHLGMNMFLAGMIVFVLKSSNPPDDPHEFDSAWLAAAIVFLLPLLLTHATGLPERIPVLYAVIYSVLAFVVLGLLGRVQLEQPARDNAGRDNAFRFFALVVFSFIADSYGEITRGSWLWFPPKPDEVRLGAWLLCKLAIEKTMPIEARLVPGRILNMVTRLKLVQITDRRLRLTSKGQDLVTEPAKIGTT